MADRTAATLDLRLLGLVPPGSRVLAGAGTSPGLVGALVDAGHEVLVACTDPEALAAATAAGAATAAADLEHGGHPGPLLAVAGGRFETVVLGDALARSRRIDVLLDACAEVMEPAGLLLATVASGLAAAGAAPLPVVLAAARRTGWEVEHVRSAVEGEDAPALVGTLVGLRPPWTPDALVRAGALLERGVEDGGADLLVLVLGDLEPSQLLGLRASLPERTTCAPIDLDADLDPDARVLVLTSDLLPRPGWIAALLAAAAEDGGPVGVRVVDELGRVVHAGAAPDGRPFATGWPAGPACASPFLTVDRRDVPLLPPFVARVRDLATEEPVVGRYLGSHAATSLDGSASTPAGPQVHLDDAFPATALVVTSDSPRRLGPAARAGFDAALDGLLAAGITPIVRWDERTPVSARSTLDHWERRGVALLGGSPADGGADDPLAHPDPPALVRALEPRLVVYGDAAAAQRHHGPTLRAGRTLAATALMVAEADARDGARSADLVAPWDAPGLAERLVALTRTRHEPPPRAVRRFAPRPRRAGVVSIVIPVWDQWAYTERCLERLAEHADRELDVVVVDNGSTDATARELAARAARGELRVVTNPTNLGFPRACNQGLDLAEGELVCILNNDTEVCAGWLAALVAALAAPGTGMVGPRSNLIAGPQVVPQGPTLDRTGTNVAAHRWAAAWASPRRDRTWVTSRLVGFCLLLRGVDLEELGGFDEGFGIGNYEDDDLCRRVLASGRSLRVADGSVVLHHGGATFAALGESYGVVMREARRHFVPDEVHRRKGLVAAIVLADGDPVAAARTAMSVARHVDHVRVVERTGLAATQLAVAAVPSDIEVVEGTCELADAVAGLVHAWVVVLEAGELFELDDADWGALRSTVELADDSIAIGASGGPQVRIVPNHGRGLAAVGAPATIALDGVRVVPDPR
jgi:GT2 family glycosyltransferase